MQSDKCNLRQHRDATTNRMAKSGILTTVNAHKDIKQSETLISSPRASWYL